MRTTVPRGSATLQVHSPTVRGGESNDLSQPTALAASSPSDRSSSPTVAVSRTHWLADVTPAKRHDRDEDAHRHEGESASSLDPGIEPEGALDQAIRHERRDDGDDRCHDE